MNLYKFKKKIKKRMQKIGLIKKFSLLSFIKKRLTSSQVGPVRKFVLVGFVLILVVVSTYFLFFSSSEVLAEWWDTNWHYRKAITITNSGSAQTNTQVKILSNYDMSTDVTNGKVQADFDDLRFTDINGNALDYWIEDDTAASLDVWVKISSIPTSTSTVYMYYGNPNASATSNAAYIIGNSTNPGISCTDIKNNRDCSDGVYYIDPDGGSSGNKFQVYCDMTIENGGWTEILNLDTNDGVDHWWGDTAFWQGTGTEGSAVTSLTSGYKSQAFTDMSSFAEMMIFMHTEGVQVAYGVYDVLGGYQSSSFYNLFSIANSDAGTTITSTLQHQSGASNVPLNTQRNQTRYGDEFIDSFNTEAIVVNRVKRFNTDGINYMRLATTFDNTSYVHTMSGLGVHHERPTGSYICKVEAAPVTAYCGLVPRYGSDATSTGCYCGSPTTSYDRDMAIFVRDSTPDAINMSFVTSGLEEKGPGPVGYWSFDEGYGTTTQDRTTNNNDGTITGATWQTEDMCVSGKCLKMNGAGGYIGINPIVMDLSENHSISAWFKVNKWDNTYTSGSAGLIQGPNGRNWDDCITVYPNLLALQDDSAVNKSVSFLDEISLNQWHHITINFKVADRIDVYLDGEYQNYTSAFSSSNTLTLDRIGRGYGSDPTIDGFLDEVKIYPYARTPAQIKADYNARAGSIGTSARLSNQQSAINNLSSGLVGYWKMDEASGNAVDSSGNSNTGTWYGTGSHYPAGKFGNGGGFNGTDDYVSVGNVAVNYLTISLWVNPLVQGGEVLRKEGNSGYHIISSAGNWAFSIKDITGGVSGWRSISISTPPIGQWTYLTMVWDGSNLKGYVNGNFNNSGEANIDRSSSSTNSLNIGAYGVVEPPRYFNGKIDEVRIYNRALTPREVNALYEWAPGPVAYWKMDEGTGTSTIYDSSGNGYNGTMYNLESSDWISGKYGKALDFDGTNEYVDIANNTVFDNLKSMTISSWYYSDIDQRNDDALVSKSNNVNSGYDWIFLEYGSHFYVNTTSGLQLVTITEPSLNTWHYATGVVEPSGSNTSIKIYIDGILTKTQEITGSWNHSSSYIRFADYHTPTAVWDGQIDEVKIYNYARTQKQILEDMNAGRPASKSPVGWWKFDEGADNTCSGGVNDACDSSEYGNDGSNIGADWTNEGKFGKALSFNGTSYVQVPDSKTLEPSTLTISAWIYINSILSSQTVLEKGRLLGDPQRTQGYHLGKWGCSGTLCFSTGDDTDKDTVSFGTLSTGQWYHVIATADGTNLKAYLNGNLQNTTSQTLDIAYTTYPLRIGSISYTTSASYYFNGLIDEVKIFNYALTEEEIKQEYNQGKVSVMGAVGGDGSGSTSSAGTAEYCVPGSSDSCDPPIAEWNFEEHSGVLAYDSSGNENTGTLTNMEETDWTVGKIGGGLDFDGENDCVELSSGTPVGSKTINAWLKISNKVNQTVLGVRVLVARDNSGKVAYYDGTSYLLSNNSLPVDTWVFLTEVFDASANTVSFYFDNVLDAVRSTSNFSQVATRIGGYNSPGNSPLQGKIDQVRIYDYARTPAQIAWDYNKGKPIAHYKMDKGEGTTIYDSSGNGNNGTLNLGSLDQTSAGSVKINANTAWYNGREGKQNYSLNFDGDDDYVDLGSDIIFSTRDWSIGLWFNSNSVSTLQDLISTTTANNLRWFNLHNSKLALWDYSNGQWYYGNTILLSNTWYYTTLVYDGSGNYEVFLNGESDSSWINLGTTDDTGVLRYIGMFNGGSRYFTGQIDEVKIFNYALSPLQIKTEYNLGAARLGTGD